MKTLEETKAVKEWCKTCAFEKIIINGKTCWEARIPMPTTITCLECLYSMFAGTNVTKPKHWRE